MDTTATPPTHSWGAAPDTLYNLGPAAPDTAAPIATGLVMTPIGTARRVLPREGERVLPLGAPSVPTPLIHGLIPGQVAWAAYTVPMAALRPATSGFVRRSYDPDRDPDYDPEKDTDLIGLKAAIQAARGSISALICRPTEETIHLGDQDYPVLEVVYGRRTYFALRALEWPEAPVRIWDAAVDTADGLLYGLAEDGQQVRLPLMDRCDAVRQLRDMGLQQTLIAQYMKHTQGYISQMEMTSRIADESPAIRRWVARGKLGVDHVDHLRKLRDADVRELATEYVVQAMLGIDATGDLVKQIQPPPEKGTPTLRLVQHTDSMTGETWVEAIDLTGRGEPSIKLTPDRHYWQLSKPLAARPARITDLAAQMDVRLTPTAGGVLVDVSTLSARQVLRRVGGNQVEFADLEAAYLADLEAIRLQLDALRRAATSSPLAQEDDAEEVS
jgi:hypothetical protein